MAEVQLNLKILIYPENGSWVAHCVEMDLPAGGRNPEDALKNLMDSVLASTSEQLGNVRATVSMVDSLSIYPFVDSIKKMRRIATKLKTSTIDAVMTPIRRMPNRLLVSGPQWQRNSNCHSGKAEPPMKMRSIICRVSKTIPSKFSFSKKENRMSEHDQDLNGDDVKYVEYSILSIKPDKEKEVLAGKEVIAGDSNSDAFTAKLIKENAKDLKDYDSKDLRVYYKVLDRYARPEKEYDKAQTHSLEEIAIATKTIAKKMKKK